MVSFDGIKTMAGYHFTHYCSLKQVYHMFMAHTHTHAELRFLPSWTL